MSQICQNCCIKMTSCLNVISILATPCVFHACERLHLVIVLSSVSMRLPGAYQTGFYLLHPRLYFLIPRSSGQNFRLVWRNDPAILRTWRIQWQKVVSSRYGMDYISAHVNAIPELDLAKWPRRYTRATYGSIFIHSGIWESRKRKVYLSTMHDTLFYMVHFL